jgi:hypothetical protein
MMWWHGELWTIAAVESLAKHVILARLIDEVVGTAGQLAEKNKNRLIVEAQDNVGALNADPMRLKQTLPSLSTRGAHLQWALGWHLAAIFSTRNAKVCCCDLSDSGHARP